MARAPNTDQRHADALRKYAPAKALGSQHQSPGAAQAGHVNTLLYRWKPCLRDVAR